MKITKSHARSKPNRRVELPQPPLVLPRRGANDDLIDEPQWFIFTSDGIGSVVTGVSIQKAIFEFLRGQQNVRRGDIVGVIAGVDAVTHHSQLRNTQVYGVICCMGKTYQEKLNN